MKSKKAFRSMVITSALGGYIMAQIGGWLVTLYIFLILMATDFVVGIMLGIVGKTPGTETGRTTSTSSSRSIFKKVTALLCIYICCMLDLWIKSDIMKEGILVAFCLVETIKVIEKLMILGVPFTLFYERLSDIFTFGAKKQ